MLPISLPVLSFFHSTKSGFAGKHLGPAAASCPLTFKVLVGDTESYATPPAMSENELRTGGEGGGGTMARS